MALAQGKRGAVEVLIPRFDQATPEKLASQSPDGHWPHDYALSGWKRGRSPAGHVGMPLEIMALMKL